MGSSVPARIDLRDQTPVRLLGAPSDRVRRIPAAPMVLVIGADKAAFDELLLHAPSGATMLEVSSRSEARRLLGEGEDENAHASGIAVFALGLELGLVTRELCFQDEHKRLTGVQFWLMRELMERPEEVVCPRFLLRQVWEVDEDSSRQPLRQCAHLLRRILTQLGSGATILHCSGGYMLTVDLATAGCSDERRAPIGEGLGEGLTVLT